jgi:Zn-dependent protease
MGTTPANPIAIEFRADFLIPLALLLVFTTFRLGAGDAAAATFFCVISLIAHEAAHAFAALLVGSKITAVGLCVHGAFIRRVKASSAERELFIALAGPAANIGIGLFLYGVDALGTWVAQFNFVLALINLLPIRGSDGTRIVASLREISARGATPVATIPAGD